MQAILGPFHPDLEDALVREILAARGHDPLCPLMILVPSEALRRRIKTLLTREKNLSLLSLHILTFHQLSRTIVAERLGTSGPAPSGDLFAEEALRQLVRRELGEGSVFARVAEREGGCAALWQTLRDLKDGTVDPQSAIEALEEGYFGPASREKLSDLFRLYEVLSRRFREWGVLDYADLDAGAVRQVPSSEFVGQFRHLFYYGFYDLTQVQLDLFHALARHTPTTLLFPLVQGHPGWSFAQSFYDRYVQGLVTGVARTRNTARHPEAGPGPLWSRLFLERPQGYRETDPRCAIFNCSGERDEILTVAKEILRLVSDEGIAFHQVGVVARHLEPYAPWIKEIFREHCIPITTSAQDPLVQFPQVKAALLLINLVSRDYLRSNLVDLISSPFFNARRFCTGGTTPRPDLWDLLTRRLGITRGVDQWLRLQRHLKAGLCLPEGEEDDGEPQGVTVSAEQVRLVWDIFSELRRDLDALPAEASWGDHVSGWKALLQKYLNIVEGNEARGASTEERARDMLLDTLEALAGLDAINANVSLDHFNRTFQHWLERSSIPLTDWNVSGVAVVDVMAARGVPFRVLFILGLNEGKFPRTIREDAFLRDRHRRVFETVLGYKVSEKLAAFDEEKLLFTLLAGAVGERLYCFYQRSDDSGRPLAPSWYLTELRRSLWGEGAVPAAGETTIPRGIVEKRGAGPFGQDRLLLPREVAVLLGLESRDPTRLVDLFLPSAPLYRRGRRMMRQLEDSGAPLSGYDGALRPRSEYWDELCQQGFSPTGLERYALCPFQFFGCNILGLGWLERPEELTTLKGSGKGRLVHDILKSFYQELLDRDYFVPDGPSVDVRATLEASARAVFSRYEMTEPVGYPVAWELLQEELLGLLDRVVAQDLQRLSRSGFRPLALEIDGADRLRGGWPSPLEGLLVHGRMDRIDYHPGKNNYRVIDYKLRSGRHRPPEDNHLTRSGLRGQRLQPPFYLLLAKRYASERAGAAVAPTVGAAFYFVAPQWPDGPLVVKPFPGDAWDGPLGEGLRETLSVILEGIRQARFFIRPGPHCDYCQVSEICRKNHLPTLWRAGHDPTTTPHRLLRRKGLPHHSRKAKDRRPPKGRRP